MKSLKFVSVFFLVLMPVVWGSISVADERSKGPAAADDSQVTSIILLQSAPPAIAETELADLVEKALRLKLSVVSDKAKPEAGAEFIQKTEAGFQIGTKQVRVMITTANTPYVSADDIQTVDDLRCRKMLQDIGRGFPWRRFLKPRSLMHSRWRPNWSTRIRSAFGSR